MQSNVLTEVILCPPIHSPLKHQVWFLVPLLYFSVSSLFLCFLIFLSILFRTAMCSLSSHPTSLLFVSTSLVYQNSVVGACKASSCFRVDIFRWLMNTVHTPVLLFQAFCKLRDVILSKVPVAYSWHGPMCCWWRNQMKACSMQSLPVPSLCDLFWVQIMGQTSR